MEIEHARSLKVIASMSWKSSWPTISKSLRKLYYNLLGLYLTEWGLLAFHDLRTFVIIRRIFLLNYLRACQFELYGEFYMFSWWKQKRSATDATAKPTFGKRTITEFSRNVMRKMTCLGTKRWSFTVDHQIFGAKVEILRKLVKACSCSNPGCWRSSRPSV